MSEQTIIYDGNFNSPQPVNPVRLSYPQEGFTPLRQYDQDFVVKAGNYTVPLMGQPHYIHTDAFLCHQSGFTHIGGGLVKYSWHYMTTPSTTFTEPIRIAATFPEIRTQVMYEGAVLNYAFNVRKEMQKQTTGKKVTRYFMLEDSVNYTVGTMVDFNGRSYEIERIDTDAEGNTFFQLDRFSVNATKVSPLGSLNTEKYDNIPIENRFEAILKTNFYKEKRWGSGDYEKTVRETRVNYISNLTEPNTDEYYAKKYILAEETELNQVLGAVWSASEYHVRPQ